MADLGKQFLDTDGLNALWTKHKKVQPFYQELGTSGTSGWVNFLTVKATAYMNHPLVVRLLCRGYSDSTMDVQFASANNTAPTIQYFKQRIQPYSGTHAIAKPGYTYEDVDGVRYYKFWLKKNEASGSIGVHVESEYFYTTGAEDTGILTFPNVQSDTEPAGIVYVKDADIVYEAVPAKTAVSAAAVKVGTNAIGQVVLGNALNKTDVGLGNVDNTSDANKPISTATQKALDEKVSKAGDTMTGPLVNTSNTANAIKVSHGAANTNAGVLAERTDTGVSVFMGVDATGSNHGVYSHKNANWIIRADGSGDVFVNDSKATSTVHIGNSDVGSTTKPVYIDDGVIKAGSTYAGGTAVTLNGTSASGSTASFYAPTDTGTNHRLLRSNGSGAPTWQIPAADYVFKGPSWNTSGDTHTFWAFRLKGIYHFSYNNVLLSFDSYFWNNQKSTSDLIWIGWSNNGNQGLVATAGRVRIAGRDNSDTPLEYYLVKNKADTYADCTVDLYIRSSLSGNSYGHFFVSVLNSGNLDLDTIIEQKGTYNVDLPEGALKIPYKGTIGSAERLSTERELAVGLGNTSTTTKFDGSADVTNIRVTGTLPVANGGTGATTPAGAQFNLIDKATTELGPMEDKHRIAIMSPEPSATNSVISGYRTGLTMWNYMKGKMSSDTGVNISGNAATATSAGKLSTGRELAVGLSNTSTTTTFDGSANVTNIKVSGQLPVANGGTGSNTAAGARTNLSVYSKSEIDSLMSGRVEIVTELPDTGKSGVTYYVGPTGSGADKYDEYIWTGSAFLKVGEHSLDLSNYVNTVATSGSGSVVTGVSKSGNTVTVTKGNISLDDLSDWATETDVTISNVTYHTMWPVAPTSSNQVYGISINNGRLFRIYNNKGAYSVQAYDKDSDTTYTPQKLGIGYGTCTTAEATAAKVATLADYMLVKNGIVAVKFSYPLCASATLNINGKGAKPVYVGGAAVTATNCKSVQAGDIGYFIYDGTAYHFLGTDRAGKSAITGLSVSGKTVTYTRSDGETGTFDTQDTTYSFADSYNASTNKGATVATVTNAINALDVTDISGFGAGKTLATLKEENGKVSATFQDISITKSQVSDFSHTHGNIQNGGTLQTNDITIANGDKLVVTDTSDSNKVARASLTFDGATTNQMLSKKGEWSDTIAKARAVVDYGSLSRAIEIGWGGASVSSASHFAVYTDSYNGYNKAIKDCKTEDVRKLINGTSVGSAAVPVFINAKGETQVCTDDFVHDDDVTSTYSSTGTAPVNGTAVAAAIGGLDVSSVGGDGKYISAISETDGKISATATTMDTTPTANSTKAVTSGGIQSALNGKAESSHTHGNITNDGKIGTTANLPVVTGTSGAVTTGTWATSASDTGSSSSAGSANTFSRGDHTHKVAVATGDSAGQVKVAGQNATVNGWDALSDRVENLEESGDVGFMGNATQDGERLILEDIIFDSIYPSIGKYGLATFPETTSTDATEFSGDRDWLLDWRPYLVDMSPVAGETAKAPVAELRKDNWLRTKDGDYAPVCGITSAQSTALDGKKDTLYWKSGSTGDKVSATIPEAFDSSGKFVPAKFWEFVKANLSTVNTKAGVTYSSPIAVKVYVGTQDYEFGAYTNYHIPAPWETTETKYSVFIGRPSDVYVVDGYSATTGEHMRGLCSKPLPVGTNKFDPEDYRLKRTGISPGPSTVVASKIRNFFYNYVVAASSGCTVNGNAGRTSIFYNNGTYPATNGPTQYRCADWSRACNSGGSSGNAVPVGEMGYHALNAFLCSVEAAYGTRNLWEYNRFSEGICSNYGADTTKGGVLVDTTWKAWNTSEATLSSTSENYSAAVNGQYAKFQCMEPQIAASLATEMGISTGSSFHWNGGDWHFEVPSNLGTVRTLGQGAMNCRMYKLTDAKTVNGHTVRCNLVCALAEGVNPVGDIWCYYGGGAELVYLTDGTGNLNYKASFYLEPDQSRWLATSATEKITSGTFPAESSYKKLLDSSTAGGLGNTYCLARTGYTPVRRISGGAYNTGECTYQYRQIDDDAKGSAGIRSRRRLLFRGGAAHTYCSPRYLTAANRPSYSAVNLGCSAQVLLA